MAEIVRTPKSIECYLDQIAHLSFVEKQHFRLCHWKKTRETSWCNEDVVFSGDKLNTSFHAVIGGRASSCWSCWKLFLIVSCHYLKFGKTISLYPGVLHTPQFYFKCTEVFPESSQVPVRCSKVFQKRKHDLATLKLTASHLKTFIASTNNLFLPKISAAGKRKQTFYKLGLYLF